MLLFLDSEQPRQVGAQVERCLGAGDQLEAPVLPAGEGGVRLHRRVLGAGGAIGLLDHHVGLLEAGVGVTVDEPEAVTDIGAGQRADTDRDGVFCGVAALGVQQRGAGRDRGERVEHGRQLLVLHRDQPRGCLGLRASGRGHRRDHIAAVAGGVGQHCLVLELAAVAAQVGHVRGGQGHGPVRQLREIHAHHPGVRVRGADEGGVPHSGQLGVVRVAGGAAEPRVAHRSSSSARRTSTAMIRRR